AHDCTARNIINPMVIRQHFNANGLLAFQFRINMLPLHKERHLARNGKKLGSNARNERKTLVKRNNFLCYKSRIERAENWVFSDNIADSRRHHQTESLFLTQGQEPRNVIQITIGKQYGLNRIVT